MKRASYLWPILLLWSTLHAWADARLTVLVDVMRLSEAAQILSNEGIGQAADINTDMLGGQGGAGWQQQVARIYAPELMVELLRAELAQELQGEELEQVISFFASDLGDKIVSLENTARVAIQEPDVEAAARARLAELEEEGDDPRLAQITAYIDSGDMISRNVVSAINSNFQFLRGLADGGAIEMTEEEMLADAASDLEGTTEDTAGWLTSFLLLAYHPLEDDELDSYIAFSETSAGQALNTALFNGFGKAYEDISYALGRAVALNMQAQEL